MKFAFSNSRMLWRLCCLFAVIQASTLVRAADLHVGAGQTYATITAALTAATTDSTDRIVVHNGTYDEASIGIDGFHWDKDVDIVAAPGETPVMTCTPPDYSYEMFVLGGLFTPNSVRTWDGIDIKVTRYWYTQGIVSMGIYSGTVTFKNMKVYDTGAVVTSVPPDTFNLPQTARLILDHVTIDCRQASVNGVLIDTGVNFLKMTHCNFIGKMNIGVNMRTATNHRAEIDNTTFTQTSTTFASGGNFITHYTGTITATDCRFILKGGGGFDEDGNPIIGNAGAYSSNTWLPGTSSPTSATLTRCLFDTRLGGNRAISLASSENGSSLKVVNSVFIDSTQVGAAGAVRTTSAAGATTVELDHCTFNNADSAADLHSIQISSDNTNTTNLVLRNNLFSIPGSNVGAVASTNADGTLGGTLNVTAGKNLRWTGGGVVGAQEKLTGTIVTGDPDLEPDLFHLGVNSAALAQGVDIAISNDYEGEVRPQPAATNPDLGADESPADPPAVVTGAGHWLSY